MSDADLDLLSINTIRTLSIDAIQKANSGHPGLPLGAAPMAFVLWQKHLKHDPADPKWPDRDRFILSAGHGSMLLYSLLHLSGYELSLDEIKKFRQWGSLTPGHPEFGLTAGVEATTGPLGQGSANAVGMAIAERKLAYLFNEPDFELFNHYTYALVSDGDLMEGVSAEAASLAGHLKLGKLIYLYDANDVTLDGPTDLTFSTENVAERYRSYGWQVLEVTDGDTDLRSLDEAISAAQKESQKPSIIVVKTTIGYGSPNLAGKSKVHGSPLGDTELAATKEALGWKEAPFEVPDSVRKHFAEGNLRSKEAHCKWAGLREKYQAKFPEKARQLELALKGELPADWDSDLPKFEPGEALATRQSSGKVLNALAKRTPWLLGGDADLGCSTNTILKEEGSFEGQEGSGRNIHYGVREHAMASIANGMEYHSGVRPFVATFFCFADYMRPAIRLAALNHLAPIYVWTHDSVGLGEDGPTHQPVEHLASLRCMPNMTVIRPCDANETAQAWHAALEHKNGPVGLVFTRQKVPTLAETQKASVAKGAYILSEASTHPRSILLATGSEVHLALEAQKTLEKSKIPTRVVSMPCWEYFAKQPMSYQDQVLPPTVTCRVAIEAASPFGWERWVGTQGLIIGLDRFGASAPGPEIYRRLGLTTETIVQETRDLFESGSES